MAMNLTRREFLRKGFQAGVGLALTGPATAYSVAGILDTQLHKPASSEPVSAQREVVSLNSYRGHTANITIQDTPFQLYGVSHTRKFAEENFDTIDKRVKDASLVVTEGSPNQMVQISDKDFASYFRTVFELCQEYNKPVLYLDPFSLGGNFADSIMTGIGAGTYLGTAFFVGDLNQTRKQFLIRAGVLAAGALFVYMGHPQFSSPIETAVAMVTAGSDDPNKFFESYFRKNFWQFNHGDQRTVQLTKRISALPPVLSQMPLAEGKYVLVNFGSYHTMGIDFYLRHPAIRKLKSYLYAPTFDLIDSDEQTLFIPRSGDWEQVPLSKIVKK